MAGLLKKLARIGVDDLRRQLKNPLKENQVLHTHTLQSSEPLGVPGFFLGFIPRLKFLVASSREESKLIGVLEHCLQNIQSVSMSP